MVDSNITIPSAGNKGAPIRGECKCFNGAKMPRNRSKFFRENFVEKPDFELRGIHFTCSHGLGTLSSSNNYMLFNWRYACCVDGAASVVVLDRLEGLCVEELRRAVDGRGDESELVFVEGHLVDGLGVLAVFLDEFKGIAVVNAEDAILSRGQDGLVQGTPHRVCDLNVLDDQLARIAGRLSQVINGVDPDSGGRPHDVVGEDEELALALRELDGPRGDTKLDVVEAISRLYVPYPHAGVSTSCDEPCGVEIYIAAVDSALVAIVSAQALTAIRVPDTRELCFAACEQQIPFTVVFHLSNGPFMPLEYDGSHE